MSHTNAVKRPSPTTNIRLRRGRYTRWLHALGGKGGHFHPGNNAVKRELRAEWKADRARRLADAARYNAELFGGADVFCVPKRKRWPE